MFDLNTNKNSLWHEITEDISAFDVTDSSIFYIERNTKIIQSVDASHINVTLNKKVKPHAIAVDDLTKKFYVLDKYAKTLGIMDFEGNNFAIVLSDLEAPDDIIMDFEEGSMFILQYMKSV